MQHRECHFMSFLFIFHFLEPPESPKLVRLSVQSPTSLRVDFEEPEETNGAVVTRYKSKSAKK